VELYRHPRMPSWHAHCMCITCHSDAAAFHPQSVLTIATTLVVAVMINSSNNNDYDNNNNNNNNNNNGTS
jgi:hypothetical protein